MNSAFLRDPPGGVLPGPPSAIDLRV